MIHRLLTTAAIGMLVIGAAACGDDDPDTDNTGDPTPAACPVDDPTCYETGAEPSGG